MRKASLRDDVSVIPLSSLDRVTAMAAGENDPFNDAVSLMLLCDTQAEIDALRAGLVQSGDQPLACGWIKDRFSVSWQIVPRRFREMIAEPDRAAAVRVATAVIGMVKFDLAVPEAAHRGP